MAMLAPKKPKPLVLVVDDDQAVRDWLRRYLAILGCDCLLAGTGEDALMQVESLEPELVLLDVVLPGMDGLRTLALLHEKYPKLPVIFLAAQQDIPTAQQALSYGALDYLAKPIDLVNLKRIVEPFLSAPR